MTTEYIPLSDPDYDMICKRILESYPKACIVYAERVLAPHLESPFQSLKESLEAKRGSEKISTSFLFHGTSEKAIQPIIEGGFDPHFNTKSAYGIGTYFSPMASMSSTYTKEKSRDDLSYMFLAEVIIGNKTTAGNSQIIDTNNFDISMNSLSDPTIYCTPYKDGAIPRFVVGFYKYAS